MIELSDLYQYAEDQGIVIDEFEMKKRESMSMMDTDGDCYIAIDPFKLRSAADEKVKLAHEIGHCDTGAFYNEHSRFDLRERHEHRATKQAIKKLIPEDELACAVGRGIRDIWELAEYFGVTEDFMRQAVDWYTTGSFVA